WQLIERARQRTLAEICTTINFGLEYSHGYPLVYPHRFGRWLARLVSRQGARHGPARRHRGRGDRGDHRRLLILVFERQCSRERSVRFAHHGHGGGNLVVICLELVPPAGISNEEIGRSEKYPGRAASGMGQRIFILSASMRSFPSAPVC